MIQVLILYVPVVLLATRVADWQKSNLIFALIVGTFFVKTSILFVYPLVISPIFSKKVPFPQDGDNRLLFEEIVQLAESNGYKNARSKIILTESRSQDLHSNAGVNSNNISLSKELLEHHAGKSGEIKAIIMHEITHWKEMHLLKKVVCIDMVYMTAFAAYLSPMLNNHTLLRTFGFS